jgi:hypothetical protein
MYLKCSVRSKDGKQHRSWSIVESRRVRGGTVQRHLLYLGEINDSQQAAWQKSIAVFAEGQAAPQQVALFPEDRVGAATDVPQIQLRLSALTLQRPRQWGACWLALELWRELRLDEFWREKLAPSREGTRWDLVLTTLALYRWLDPGSEWRLHRAWFERSALGDLLDQDCSVVADDTLYRCHDLLLAHQAALFTHLQERWRDLFNAKFDVLLYDLTSTYFECGTPKGRLSQLEKELAALPWQEARAGVLVKLLPQEGELYVFAQSEARIEKERAMRRQRLGKLWARLKTLQAQTLPYKDLLMKLGAAKGEAGLCWGALAVTLPEPPAKAQKAEPVTFSFRVNRARLRQMRRREGRYLLRSNLSESDPAALWQHYITLTQIEEAFKNLKGDLRVRPVFHQKEDRIEAHIFIAFLAYCLHVTLGRRLHAFAPGLTARAVLAKFAAISMVDVHLPTTDGRTLQLTRHTQPDQETELLLARLKLQLPPQPPPKITAPVTA